MSKEDQLIKHIDRAITELVYEKHKLVKAYNYYNGKRDPEQFRHLEENYGIGTPTSVEFIPLVRKHIDVLIGEYLSMPLNPKITCKDEHTLSNIKREKQLAINKSIIEELNKHLKSAIYAAINPSPNGQPVPEDKELKKLIQKVVEETDRNFVSDYEIAAQNIVQYLLQSRDIDMRNKLKIILTDLLITGTCYYKVSKSGSGENINFRALNPLNTFIDRNPYSPYLRDSYRSVVREYLTKPQILERYGHLLGKGDLEKLDTLSDMNFDGNTSTYLRSYDTAVGAPITTDGVLGGFEITPLLPYERTTSQYYRLFPVYEVEWIDSVKDKSSGKYVMKRFEGIRINSNIYIPIGEVENDNRSMDDPGVCTLTVNGTFYSDRNGDPFSLILATANLQDKYDALHFHRDNIIAQSGVSGDWMDLAYLPKFLGNDEVERLMKWRSYKKGGLALIDTSQEGTPPMNTTYGGFDDSLKLQAIQAIELAIQRTEETCSTITGVFRERLGGIEQKDAVTNVQVGVKNSAMITKQYYQLMDLMTREILLDSLNLAKEVYKNGITGTLILGDRLSKVFTALPEHFTITSHMIDIGDSSEVVKDIETMKQIGMEFIKGGLVEADIIIDIMTAKGMTQMKYDLKTSLAKKKEENNQLQQLQQQAQQMQEQLKELQKQNQQLTNKLQSQTELKLQLDQERLQFDKELGWYEAKNLKEYNEAKLEEEKKRVQLEGAQLLDPSRLNDEIKNN